VGPVDDHHGVVVGVVAQLVRGGQRIEPPIVGQFVERDTLHAQLVVVEELAPRAVPEGGGIDD
jgi:hypothetical protein